MVKNLHEVCVNNRLELLEWQKTKFSQWQL